MKIHLAYKMQKNVTQHTLNNHVRIKMGFGSKATYRIGRYVCVWKNNNCRLKL